MNAKDRDALNTVLSALEKLKIKIEDKASAEREKYDNMSENLQGGERGQKMDEAATALESAVNSLDDALALIEEAKSE